MNESENILHLLVKIFGKFMCLFCGISIGLSVAGYLFSVRQYNLTETLSVIFIISAFVWFVLRESTAKILENIDAEKQRIEEMEEVVEQAKEESKEKTLEEMLDNLEDLYNGHKKRRN